MEHEKYRIGILSDTHGLLRPEITEILKSCDGILHGGDINRQEILDQLKEIAPVHVVRGNNDKEWAKDIPAELEVELYGIKFYMIHNKKEMRKNLDGIDVVVYGHSHKYEERQEGERTYLNPGSCGPRRFRQPVTMAILEIFPAEHRYQIEKIDLTESDEGKQADMQKNLPTSKRDMQKMISAIIREMNAGHSIDAIAKKHGIDRELTEQICRIYVTHPGVDAQGIMNKMEVSALYDKAK